MLTKSISFKNFSLKKKNSIKIKKNLTFILKNKSQIIQSLSKGYKNSFDKKKLKQYKKFSNYRIIGMGGSTLGAQSIYDFLKQKIKKRFTFIDNLQADRKLEKKKKLSKFSNFKIRQYN